MNAENFSSFLQSPAQLHTVSYQELKTLVLQYPYSPHLRLLLLLKSRLDDHREFEHNLHLAASYLPDRAFLLAFVQSVVPLSQEEVFHLAEEVLELKDLATLRAEREQALSLEALIVTPLPPELPRNNKSEPEPPESTVPPFPEVESSRPAPLPKSSFRSFKKLAEIPEGPAQRAEASVQQSAGLISETLAFLLEKQGHRQQAIDMYEKLRLIFPEKSDFFARKIENLKNPF